MPVESLQKPPPVLQPVVAESQMAHTLLVKSQKLDCEHSEASVHGIGVHIPDSQVSNMFTQSEVEEQAAHKLFELLQ